MENDFIWSKVLLSTIKVALGVNRHYDRVIKGRAIRLTGVYQECQSDFESTYIQTEKILRYIEEKKRVVKIYSICEEILNSVHLNYRKALYIKYKCRSSADKIEQILGCTMRTYFRHINQGLKQFDEIRLKLGYTDEYLNEIFGNDSWIKNLIAIEEENAYVKANKNLKTNDVAKNDLSKQAQNDLKVTKLKQIIKKEKNCICCNECKKVDKPCGAVECYIKNPNKKGRLEIPIGINDDLPKAA